MNELSKFFRDYLENIQKKPQLELYHMDQQTSSFLLELLDS